MTALTPLIKSQCWFWLLILISATCTLQPKNVQPPPTTQQYIDNFQPFLDYTQYQAAKSAQFKQQNWELRELMHTLLDFLLDPSSQGKPLTFKQITTWQTVPLYLNQLYDTYRKLDFNDSPKTDSSLPAEPTNRSIMQDTLVTTALLSKFTPKLLYELTLEELSDLITIQQQVLLLVEQSATAQLSPSDQITVKRQLTVFKHLSVQLDPLKPWIIKFPRLFFRDMADVDDQISSLAEDNIVVSSNFSRLHSDLKRRTNQLAKLFPQPLAPEK